MTITLTGVLDAATGSLLLETLHAELEHGPSRVDVDVRALIGSTPEGTTALAACREAAAARLPGGLHYRTDNGAGEAAVLAAFA